MDKKKLGILITACYATYVLKVVKTSKNFMHIFCLYSPHQIFIITYARCLLGIQVTSEVQQKGRGGGQVVSLFLSTLTIRVRILLKSTICAKICLKRTKINKTRPILKNVQQIDFIRGKFYKIVPDLITPMSFFLAKLSIQFKIIPT